MNILQTPPLQNHLPKPIAIVLWLFFFFPVGLWLLWRDPRPPLRLKQIVTGFYAVAFIANAIYNKSPAGRAEQAASDRAEAAAAHQQQESATAQAKVEQSNKAAQAKADAKEEVSSQIEWQRQKRITGTSLATMRHDFLRYPNSELISAVEEGSDPYEVKITVKNNWFLRVRQVRLQSAQNLWSEWAQLRSPDKPGRAYIDIVDVNGNRVGGSNILDGTTVYVDD